MTKCQNDLLVCQIRKAIKDLDYMIVLDFGVTIRELQDVLIQATVEEEKWNVSADEQGCF